MKLIEKNLGLGPNGTTIFQYAIDFSEESLPKKRGRKSADIAPDILAALKIAGYSNVAIGKKLKINESTVRKYLKELV